MKEEYLNMETDMFTKEQILKSERYKEHRDVLSAILAETKNYSVAEVEELFQGFQKGRVE